MTLELKTGWHKRERFVLQVDCVVVEEDWWFLHHRGSFPYGQLSSRSVRQKRSLFWPLVIFLALAVIPALFFYAEHKGFGGFSIGGFLFSVPALIALREVLRSSRHTLLFLERSDGGVAIRLFYRSRESAKVEEFAKELRRRIKNATPKDDAAS